METSGPRQGDNAGRPNAGASGAQYAMRPLPCLPHETCGTGHWARTLRCVRSSIRLGAVLIVLWHVETHIGLPLIS